jgi:iron(III) transport system permease protein
MKPALVISLIYVFLVSIKDLGAAVILVTAQSQVLSAVIFQFWNAGHFPVAAAAGIFFVLVLSTLLVVVLLIFKANPTALVSPESERVSVSSVREAKSAPAWIF